LVDTNQRVTTMATSALALNNPQNAIKPMTDEELVTYCTEEISRGIGGDAGTDRDTDISIPLDYYMGRLPGLTPARARDKNASRFVSQDVMDSIEATVAEIMPAFSNEEIGFYEPCDEMDEDAAKTESEIVNYLLMEEYDGYTILQTALKDCLLHRNCSAKVFWDERVEVEYETFEDVPELALGQILTPESEDQTIEVVEQYITAEGDDAARLMVQEAMDDPSKMQNLSPQEQQLAQKIQMDAQDKYTVKVKRITKIGRPMIKSIPPEQTIVQSSHDSVFLHTCGFVAHESLETQSSLIAQGYDPEIINQLPDYTSDVESLSRSREPEENDYQTSHRSTRLIRVFECYPEVDFDGDGIAERRKVVISGNQLLDNEEFTGMAIIGGAVIINPHKYKGISMFDRVRDIQDAKTPVMRSVIDGTQLSSNPRLGVTQGAANIDDILMSRTGGIVRFEKHASANNVFELPKGEVPMSSYAFLEHMDGIRRDRGGGAVDSAAQANMVGGDSAHGLERVMTKMEMTNALLARTLGETFVRGIFIELHNILRKNHKGTIERKIGGHWRRTMPEQWRRRTSVTIQVGDSLAERARQSNMLRGVIDLQKTLAAEGSVMYEENKAYKAISDAIRLGGIRAPERYFIDPSSPEGQQKSQFIEMMKKQMKEMEQQAQMILIQAQDKLANAEQMKAKADNDANVVKLENEGLKAQLAQVKTELDAMGKTAELQFKYDQLMENVALKLTELEATNNRELSEQHESNLERETMAEERAEDED
jgi:ABC-type oligopeptide transport system ATPase subunit